MSDKKPRPQGMLDDVAEPVLAVEGDVPAFDPQFYIAEMNRMRARMEAAEANAAAVGAENAALREVKRIVGAVALSRGDPSLVSVDVQKDTTRDQVRFAVIVKNPMVGESYVSESQLATVTDTASFVRNVADDIALKIIEEIPSRLRISIKQPNPVIPKIRSRSSAFIDELAYEPNPDLTPRFKRP